MATIRRYGNGNERNFIVFFELSNGKKYFVGDGYVFLSLKKEMTLEELVPISRLYTYRGSRIITDRIWKEFNTCNEHLNGGHIIHSACYTIEHLKRYCYNCNGNKLINVL